MVPGGTAVGNPQEVPETFVPDESEERRRRLFGPENILYRIGSLIGR